MPGELEAVFVDGAWYEAQIDDARTDESSNSGTPGIIFLWTVTEGEMAGKSAVDERWISTNNVERQRKEIFEALGYDIGIEDLDNVKSLVGKQARIRITIKEFPIGSGKKQTKVGRIRKKGEEGESMLSPAQRIKRLCGVVDEKEKEWEKDKKF